ncbi:TetR/AcrR family transcriptional regulator [Phenylobacterium montanum]|uniref:TetR/AcrR family transcriptional regulator n=1 Tax=Phenylobacterium montanum TaxID=2823693 RepID=A0A975G1I1_9CAUL|nr:TetR family transcriptional regulator C-terminal domain-containing protein [Caulobacter sp. S6]QUD89375.1 TetR/AcrR family transcriptional regulator [Caulobacter sp. S6]
MDGTQGETGRRKRLSHDERRLKLIETTLTCLARDGAEGTSLRSVCREMGVAPSLVKHFFEGWRDLLVAAYELLVERFMASLEPVVNAAYPNARARMDAVIHTYLSTDWAGDSSIGASIAFWQLSRSLPELKASFTRYLNGRRALLQQALEDLTVEAGVEVDLEQLTTAFMLMLDGVWLEISVNPGNIAESGAHAMCWFWLDAVLAGRRKAG